MVGPRVRLAVRDIVHVGLLAAILMAAQVSLAALPNIELVSLLVIVYTLHFRRLAVYIIYVFVLLQGILYGFGIWWLAYLYVWTILHIAVRLLGESRSPLLWALAGGLFGLCFGTLTALPYLIAGGIHAAVSYIIAGIPFDISHGIGNFVTILVLFAPVNHLLTRARAAALPPGEELTPREDEDA